ncbi:hypothetical protein C8R43DRAFT_1243381 [Mycena crocata]|nr:hypothetical protein C8R43DRAFT_1243381 [Mycena crocata]
MADPPSDSSSRSRPSTYLHKACLNCRHRKIRCDGDRPVCLQCRLRPPRTLASCKYSHTPVGGVSPQLEEIVEAMKNRIHQLEISTGQDPSTVFLSEPYPTRIPHDSDPRLSIRKDGWHNLTSPFATPSPLETPPELTTPLVDIFLKRFAQDPFFFLKPTKLRDATLLPFPTTQVGVDPLPISLLNVVHLWAGRIASAPIADTGYSEADLLERTAVSLARDMMITQHQPWILTIIQAEVLLSLYFLDSARVLEGRYYCGAVTSLALTLGLHRLASTPSTAFPSFFLHSDLVMPQNDEHAKEMVHAFWSVVLLNNYWVAASGMPSSISSDARMNTPWPVHPSAASSQIASAQSQFPGESRLEDVSGFELLVNASCLLQRTITLLGHDPGFPQPPEFWALDQQLEAFRVQLPTQNPLTTGCLVTHALVNAALLRIHGPSSYAYTLARFRCLTAARAVTTLLRSINLTEWDCVDSILGPLLGAVADFYIGHLGSGTEAVTDHADLQVILSSMHTLARSSPLIRASHSLFYG